jgi:hypothetical protein
MASKFMARSYSFQPHLGFEDFPTLQVDPFPNKRLNFEVWNFNPALRNDFVAVRRSNVTVQNCTEYATSIISFGITDT